MLKRAILSLLLFAFAPRPAIAEAPSATAEAAAVAAEAKEAFELGKQLFQHGEYSAALPHFKKAYKLSDGRPSTVLALAQCERALHLYDDALKHYREYLSKAPTKEEAQRIHDTLVDVEGEQAQFDADQTLPRPEPAPELIKAEPTLEAPAPQEENSLLASPWFWLVTGVVVAGAGTAIVLFATDAGVEPYGGSTGVVARPLISF